MKAKTTGEFSVHVSKTLCSQGNPSYILTMCSKLLGFGHDFPSFLSIGIHSDLKVVSRGLKGTMAVGPTIYPHFGHP